MNLNQRVASALVLAIGLVAVFPSIAGALSPIVSPGTAAYGALGQIEPALRARNLRVACRSFGEYRAHAAYVNEANTDQWTSRNLNYAADYIRPVESFCSGPDSTTTLEQAIAAARSATSTIGLESLQ